EPLRRRGHACSWLASLERRGAVAEVQERDGALRNVAVDDDLLRHALEHPLERFEMEPLAGDRLGLVVLLQDGREASHLTFCPEDALLAIGLGGAEDLLSLAAGLRQPIFAVAERLVAELLAL